MEKQIPTVSGILVGMCILPDNKHFECAKTYFENYVLLKETKYKKRKMLAKYAYEKTAEDLNMNINTVMSSVKKALNHGYKRSKFKYLFSYFGIYSDVGFRPSPLEVANLMVLIERDRQKLLKEQEII